MLPLFLKLAGRLVVVVGGGPVAAGKLQQLIAAGARVRVVAPEICDAIVVHEGSVELVRRAFEDADLDDAWLVVAAATPEVNRSVAAAGESRRVFVNAVDDPPNASAYLGGVVRRDGVTIAISTSGEAPALAALLKESIDDTLPPNLDEWVAEARRQRAIWRRDGVPMAERKPRLRAALDRLRSTTARTEITEPSKAGSAGPVAERTSLGHVALVGAGPGDPGLLTRTAILRLRAADLVLYDALIDDRILRVARKAQRFFVGKRAGRQAMSQAAIQAVMIRAARRGRHVVRLKGGDPFVFGRGGEEMLALQAAGVPCEVVPGVSSAIAAPELAGIPVTHRGAASAFHVVSGHDVEGFATDVAGVDSRGTTLVVLMGTANAEAVAGVLLSQGWAGTTPAAVIFNASLPDQTVWRGALVDLASGIRESANGGPGTLVVGAVAALGVAATVRGTETERKYGNG